MPQAGGKSNWIWWNTEISFIRAMGGH
jgi:hypothetical protein